MWNKSNGKPICKSNCKISLINSWMMLFLLSLLNCSLEAPIPDTQAAADPSTTTTPLAVTSGTDPVPTPTTVPSQKQSAAAALKPVEKINPMVRN